MSGSQQLVKASHFTHKSQVMNTSNIKITLSLNLAYELSFGKAKYTIYLPLSYLINKKKRLQVMNHFRQAQANFATEYCYTYTNIIQL